MPQASCVATKEGDPKLVVSVSLANQSEPIVQGYGVTLNSSFVFRSIQIVIANLMIIEI